MVTLAGEARPRELGHAACAKSVEWQEATAYKRRSALLALGELLCPDAPTPDSTLLYDTFHEKN